MEQRKTTRIHRPTILHHEKETTGNAMKIGGLQKTSLLDYPDHISAIIWTLGCNFHCPFCYNTDIVNQTIPEIKEQEVLNFLHKRKKQLETVVITGGEPLIYTDLDSFLHKIKKMGYLIKLDTNGSLPQYLKKLLDQQLLDYVAMDIKAPPEKYHKLTETNVNIDDINTSINLIRENALDYEFRTTFIPKYLTKEDILKIAKWLNPSKRYILQQYKHDTQHLSNSIKKLKPYSKQYILETFNHIKNNFKECSIRGV
jgi:pyruvate formate lyase activating enzyme